MVRGDTDDGVARNLLAEIEEEAKEDEADSRVQGGTPAAEASLPVGGSPMVDAPPLVVDLTKETPQTPATRAMNEFPPRFPSDWVPARALELLTAKNEVLKCLRVIKVAPSGEMRDPGFAVMNDAEQIVRAIIGVFNTGGCSVAILDPHKLVSFPVDRLRAAGQATYDLFLRHQAKKVIEAAAKSSIHDLVDGSELQRLAERYMGMSKDEATEMKEKVARQKAMIKSLESYLQDMADEQARLRTALEDRGACMQQSARVVVGSQGDRHGNVPTPASSSTMQPTPGDSTSSRRPASSVKETLSEMLGKTFRPTGVKAEADAKPSTLDAKLPLPGVKDAGKENPSTTDYLADIYEDCLAQMQGSFLGSLNYYHRFVEHFAVYAAALYEVTPRYLVLAKTSPEHLATARVAFEVLKKKLAETPILRHFDPERRPIVVIYANDWAVASSLLQENEG
ncbi:hypothetical protein P43SY_009968 [Pythium insidiosum]|uniref:Reverse transcriptase/retrotransposon-derived protein RNase H-like domain-containing protein n=1 Tax=Pythium insidiosum TaxID=114742 RepID=A0AAD5Q396_PYTIN|nr:hypothetical protein P43SY_009968 [Pythium insidiosum]